MTQDMNAAKAHVPGVLDDIKKRDAAGPALGGEHPVASPGIIRNVALAAEPDVEAVKGVVENRQPDPEQFEVENEGKARQEFDLLGVRGRAAGGECVGDEMFDQERADRNDAA